MLAALGVLAALGRCCHDGYRPVCFLQEPCQADEARFLNDFGFALGPALPPRRKTGHGRGQTACFHATLSDWALGLRFGPGRG